MPNIFLHRNKNLHNLNYQQYLSKMFFSNYDIVIYK